MKHFKAPINYVYAFLGIFLLVISINWISYPKIDFNDLTRIERLNTVPCDDPNIMLFYNDISEEALGFKMSVERGAYFIDNDNGNCRLVRPSGIETSIVVRMGYDYFWDSVFHSSDPSLTFGMNVD